MLMSSTSASLMYPLTSSNLAGNMLFDPLKLSLIDLTYKRFLTTERRDPMDILNDYREAELKHARLAMLAAVAYPVQESLASTLHLPNRLVHEVLSPLLINGELDAMTLCLVNHSGQTQRRQHVASPIKKKLSFFFSAAHAMPDKQKKRKFNVGHPPKSSRVSPNFPEFPISMLPPARWLLVRCEAVKMVGVLPFFAWAALRCTDSTSDAKLIASIVAANGVLCHLSSALQSTWRHVWRAVDMACNAVFVVYINVRSQWGWTGVLTLVALVGWQASRPSACLAHAWTHVLLVQWTLLWCLAEYHRTSTG